MATPGRDDRSLGELFSELSREMGTLVRKELELATTEMTAAMSGSLLLAARSHTRDC
jgi:hypothetical protein